MNMEDHGTESMEALREGWRHAKQHRSWLDFSDFNNCISFFLGNTLWYLGVKEQDFYNLYSNGSEKLTDDSYTAS